MTFSTLSPALAQTTYTWTQNSAATQTWTTAGNWDVNGVYATGTGNTLRFFADTTTALANGTNTITTSVPATLSLNVLTLNGRATSTGGGSTTINIASSSSTWTLGGTTPTVNLSGVNNSSRALTYDVAANLTLGANTLFTGSGNGTFRFTGMISDGGSGFGITKTGSSNLTLAGTNTYTGDTRVTVGTLTLNYTTNNTSKLSDTGVLYLGGLADGTTIANVALTGGTHIEEVASTSLVAGSTSSLTRSSGTSVLALKTITPNTGILNVGSSGIATTTNPNTNGILGNWATVGDDWATSNSGSIEALSSYTNTSSTSASTYTNANIDVTSTQILAGAISANSIRFNAAASNTLTLVGENTLSSGGILVGTTVSTNASQITGGTLTAANNANLVITHKGTAASGALTIGSNITNNGTTTLVKHGQGTLILAGNNDYSGGTIIGAQGGYIQVASDSNLGAASSSVTTYSNTGGGLRLGDGFVSSSNRTLNILSASDIVVASGTATWAGTIDMQNVIGSQIRTASFASNATLILKGAVTNALATNNVIVHQGGNMILDSGFSVSASSAANLLLGRSSTQSTLTARGTSSTTLGAMLLNASTTSASATLTIQDSARLTGTNLDLNNNGATTSVATVNLNGGRLTVNSVLKNRTGATQTAVVNLNGGELRAGATSATFWSNLAGTTANVLAGGAKIHTNGNDITIGQALLSGEANDGGLEKRGAGALTLTGTNTYTGTTEITEGTLILGTGGGIANSSTINIASGARLQTLGMTIEPGQTLSGFGTVAGDLNVTGTLSIGASPGTMTYEDDLTFNTGSIANFEINSFTSGNFDLALAALSGTQVVTFNGGTLNLIFASGFNTNGSVKIFDFDQYAGTGFDSVVSTGLAAGHTASFDKFTGVVTVVPEPGAALLGGLGALALLRRRR